MKTLLSLASIIFATLIALGPLSAQAADTAASSATLATVNGTAIPAAQADLIQLQRKAAGKAPVDEKILRQHMITLEVLAQEARKAGTDRDPEVQAALAMATRELLAKAFEQHLASKIQVSDKDVQSAYDEIKAKESNRKEFHAGHILVKDEALAKRLLADLRAKKAKFEDLAKKNSQDPGTKEKGGDLGWVTADALVPEFAKAMSETKPGALSAVPVKTRFGWHIIRVVAMRPIQLPSFDSAKDDLRQQILAQMVRRAIAEKVAAAKVE